MDEINIPESKPLVSVITPCYNGERFMVQWADNLAQQDYPHVEVILVNDGSTDGSAAAFKKESERLKRRGYVVHYVEKPNGGAADAVNHGLPLVSGAYIMLSDMDDFLFPEAISAKADYLTEHGDVDLVRNNGYAVREQNIDDESLFIGEKESEFNPNPFDALIHMRITPYPGSYMVRSNALFARLNDRKIYVSQFGQNFQMVVPVAYFGKSGYIGRPLMKYVHYAKSHSHTKNFERRLELHNGYEGNMIACISMLDISEAEKQEYIDIAKKSNLEGRFLIGIEYQKRELIAEQYKLMKKYGLVTSRVKWMFFISNLPLGCFAIKSWPRAKRVTKRLLYRIR